MPSTTLLKLKDVQCRYDGKIIIDRISFNVKKGSIVCLLGPSGCGKTTLLRAIAGFEPVYQGEIQMNGDVISRPGYTLTPDRRQLGMVFQDYALFPHMTVGDNVRFGIRNKPTHEEEALMQRMLSLVGMHEFARRYPHELSGGQQQRVALARSLAAQPMAILFDEPFSNLDVDLRERLSTDVKTILAQEDITGILVTHHQDEAFALAEKIGVMNDGHILQWDSAFNLYHEPNSRFVADFIGHGVFINGTLLAPDRIDTEFGILSGGKAYPWPVGSKVELLFRPDDVVSNPKSTLKGKIIQKAFKGAEILYTLQMPTGSTVLSLFPSHEDFATGECVNVSMDMQHVVAFSKDEPTLDSAIGYESND